MKVSSNEVNNCYNNKYKITTTNVVQKVVLIGSTVTAILSLIPATRYGASLALRALSLISAASASKTDWESGHYSLIHNTMNVLKIGAIALGVLAIVLSAPIWLIPALSVDLAFQAFQLASSAVNAEDPYAGIKVFNHAAMIIVNTLLLIGVATASWELMVSAAAISIVAMIGFACYAGFKAKHDADYIDVFCYLVLAVVGLTASITTAKIYSRDLKFRYTIDNTKKDEPLTLTTFGGQYKQTIMPGEMKTFFLERRWDLHDPTNPNVWYYPAERISTSIVTQEPIAYANFPQLPFSGLVLGNSTETSEDLIA